MTAVKTLRRRLKKVFKAESAKQDARIPPIKETIVKQLVFESEDITHSADTMLQITSLDRMSLLDRYALPHLKRMSSEDEAHFVKPLLSLQRMEKLNLDSEGFEFPEAHYKLLYNKIVAKAPYCSATDDKARTFKGNSASELNTFMNQEDGGVIAISSPSLILDTTIKVPNRTILLGRGTRLVSGSSEIEKAIVLNEVSDSAVAEFNITNCCKYPIFVKNSSNFTIANNTISFIPFKGITIMGENHTFVIRGNRLKHTGNGGLFFNGDVSSGVIEDNIIDHTGGTGNFSGGIVLSSIEIQDIETAFNPWKQWNLVDLTESPHNLVMIRNQIRWGSANGIYSHGGYCNYVIENIIEDNNKEGMCLDFGSCGFYVSCNVIKRNGGRFGMDERQLTEDFIQDFGVLSDGSSPAKIPGISLDNAAYNIIYHNIVAENYGSGIKMVRSGLRNVILCNEVTDNNLGENDKFHFFGIELGSDFKPDYETEDVHELDFTPCFENIIARNTISGHHYSGIFLGKDAFINDVFDNTIIGSQRAIEIISSKFNSIINNYSIVNS